VDTTYSSLIQLQSRQNSSQNALMFWAIYHKSSANETDFEPILHYYVLEFRAVHTVLRRIVSNANAFVARSTKISKFMKLPNAFLIRLALSINFCPANWCANMNAPIQFQQVSSLIQMFFRPNLLHYQKRELCNSKQWKYRCQSLSWAENLL